MMKKILAVLTALLFVAAAASAEEETLLEKTVRIAEDGENLGPINEDDMLDMIGIGPDEYTDYAYLADYNALSAREVIVVRAKDEDAAKTIAEKLENYREQRMRETRNYQPEAYRVLNEAEVLQKDLLVVLSIAAPDPAEAELLLQEE